MKILNKIVSAGLHRAMTPLQIRYVKLLNSFVMLAIFLAFIMAVVEGYFQYWAQSITAGLSIVLIFVPTLILNVNRNHFIAKLYFFVMTSLVIFVTALYLISTNHNSGTENLLIALALGAIVLFDGKAKLPLFLLIVAELFAVIIIRSYWQSSGGFSDYPITLLNYGFVFAAVYFFYSRSQAEFVASHQKVLKLNRQLSEEKDKVNETQSILYSMIDHVPLIICMLDAKGRFMAMNRLFASDFGFDVEQMIGRYYKESLPCDFLKTQDRYFERSLAGERVDFDEEVQLSNGNRVPAYGSHVPIKGADGEVLAVTFFAANVTEIKDKEEQLKRLNATKNKLFSVIAHDLRNPLNLLNGLVFISKDEEMTTEARVEHAERIEKHLQALTLMLDNLLIWARGQMEGRPDESSTVNLKEIISQELKVYNEMIRAKNIDLVFKIDPSHLVSLNETALRMIIRNVYTNAIKFTPAHGKIEIDSWESAGDIFIKVKDSGIGMPLEMLEKIRSGSFIHSQEGTAGEKGAGIGLYLGLEMMKESGGKYHIQSEEGCGTEFILQLPEHVQKEQILA